MRPRRLRLPTRLYERLRPVRVRLTLLATVLVTVALTIAAVILVLAIHQVLLHSADTATTSRAKQIADVIAVEGIGGVDTSMLNPTRNVDIVQIVDATGRLRLSSSHASTTPLAPGVAVGASSIVDGATTTDSGPEYRATLVGVHTPDGPMTIEVGALERPIDWLVLSVELMCCIVFPIIVIGMALLTYYFVGRALAPVEIIRRQVSEISGDGLHHRVPVPSTGDEIATLATTMNEMLDRIDTARTQQVQFVNDASHELNSPLTTLVGLLDLARTTGQHIDPDTIDTVMMPEAQRLQTMVADLLLLARADESGVPLRITDVDLDEIVALKLPAWKRWVVGTSTCELRRSACVVTPKNSRVRCVTSPTTQLVTPTTALPSPWRCRGPGIRSRSRSPITGPVLPTPTKPGSSNDSCVWTPAVNAAAAAPDSGWRSSPRSSVPTTAKSSSPTLPEAAPPSASHCRWLDGRYRVRRQVVNRRRQRPGGSRPRGRSRLPCSRTECRFGGEDN